MHTTPVWPIRIESIIPSIGMSMTSRYLMWTQKYLSQKCNNLTKYRQEEPISVNRGEVMTSYLGMMIDFSKNGKFSFSMKGYIDQVLAKAPSDMMGMASIPAANHLYNTQQQESPALNQFQGELFHHIRVHLLYLWSYVREQDLTFKSWLRPSCTQVSAPDEWDWKSWANAPDT